MNTISKVIYHIRNLLPYLLLISVYFFFVNLEARKDIEENLNSEQKNNLLNKTNENKNLRIQIPVIPYNQ